MYEVKIHFDVSSKKDIAKALTQIKKQIKIGEFHDIKNPEGYCANKYSNIKMKNDDGFTIGVFRVFDLGNKTIQYLK